MKKCFFSDIVSFSKSENMKVIGLLFVALCVVCTYALDCPECDKSRCKEVKCRWGVTTDVCGCCPACFKGIGEVCGGPWDVFGHCAHNLVCVKLPRPDGKRDPVHEFNAKGKCVPLVE